MKNSKNDNEILRNINHVMRVGELVMAQPDTNRHPLGVHNIYATRYSSFIWAARNFICFIFGHKECGKYPEITTTCSRCGETVSFGPESTKDWPDGMKIIYGVKK